MPSFFRQLAKLLRAGAALTLALAVWVLWKIFLAEPNPLATATVCIVRQQQHGGDVWVMIGPALLGQSLVNFCDTNAALP